jgi:Zn-dependent protease
VHGFRLGRWFGIDFDVDFNWVFIFVYMTLSLTNVFSGAHPDWSRPLSVVVATVASVLFFVCILLHELAHSLVAMRVGLPVRSITLLIFGGVSNIEREPSSARAEFAMAIVGPLTSIALGVMFLVIAGAIVSRSGDGTADVTHALAKLGPATTLLAWLGPVNVALGIFNLVPAFPLDGGRVFRSILWGLSGDLHFATVVASTLGQAIAWIFIVAGMATIFGVHLPWLAGGAPSGLWLVIVGWFLHGAAHAHRRPSSGDTPADRGGARSVTSR